MTKKQILYRCAACGSESLKWQGRCPDCGEWNTFHEERTNASTPKSRISISSDARITPLESVTDAKSERFSSGSKEFDRVLGGGIVDGSFVLLGGDPGIGKSTLLLQTAAHASNADKTVLYASAEESVGQIHMRSKRLGLSASSVKLISTNDIEDLERAIETADPSLIIADSIQTFFSPDLQSAPGTVSQVRQCAARLMSIAKNRGAATFLVGHVTKDGSLAGPRILEHMVDTVLYFEGDRYQSFRILRTNKNRFGSTNEIGVFEMVQNGLKDVPDPSRFFMEEHEQPVTGSALTAVQEGTRVLVLEVQALVARSTFPTPQRVSTGLEKQRLSMLLAVLENRSGIVTSDKDVFVNVVGGAKLVDPAGDLGIALAIASAVRNRVVTHGTVAAGEIGLGGEIRRVTHLETRTKEVEKLGLKRFIIPARHKKHPEGTNLSMLPVENVSTAIHRALQHDHKGIST